MKLLSCKLTSILGQTALATAVLGVLLAVGAPAAKAHDRDDCNRRITYTEYRYNQAVERHGPDSSQARHWAHQRREAYERLERLRHEHRDWR
jgi:hypothetical protein